MEKAIKVQTLHLFDVLDTMLIDLLRSLTEEEWQAQTVAKLWKVKDVAAHLLDGNLRALSISRDGYFGETPENVNSYQDLVDFLNNLNLTWTQATKRLSPQVLIWLLETSGKQYTEYLQTLDPFADAIFPVAWAGRILRPTGFTSPANTPKSFCISSRYVMRWVNRDCLRGSSIIHSLIH